LESCRFAASRAIRLLAKLLILPEAQSANKFALYPKVMILADGNVDGRKSRSQSLPSWVHVEKEPPFSPWIATILKQLSIPTVLF